MNRSFPSSTALIVTAVLLLPAIGCTKRTPVEEISVAGSGVSVVERDMSSIATQWAQWRGPSGNGVAPVDSDQVVPTQWSENENVRWVSEVPGRGHSSPIVVGGLVVIGSCVDQESKQLVVAYDQATGEKAWETTVHQGGLPSTREVHHKATNANSTLASDGELLVTAHLNRERVFVTALDIDGNQVWQRDIGAFASKFGYAPSPVIYNSLVIVAADNMGGGYLVGLDLASGEIAWRRKRGNASSYSSPAVATVGGIDQVLITGGDRLASYDPATGEPIWETPCISEATCGTVITTSDKIFASGGYPDKETVCLSADGQKVWSNRTKVYEPSMITDGTSVFAISDNGIATCWSAEDGSKQWTERLGGNFSSSPVIDAGNVFVADLSGNVYVFAASSESFKLVAKNRLGDDCYASPAIAGGALYFRVGIGEGASRSEKLFCIANEDS